MPEIVKPEAVGPAVLHACHELNDVPQSVLLRTQPLAQHT